MKLDHETWAKVYPFLEEAQEVPPAELPDWLARITAEHPEISEPLRSVLESMDETGVGSFLDRPMQMPPEEPSRVGQKLGAYTIESLLGQGGMGEVWLAQRSDGHFKGQFAVKFLQTYSHSPKSLDRFRREGRMLARLTHPNIARLIDAGVTPNDQPYLVLEYVKGEPIDEYCKSHALSIDDRVRLFLEVLAAVAHAHTNLIVHRDIKPSNVLVTSEGAVKLLDFGIAKLIATDLAPEEQTQATRIEDVALTPDFAAPEQVLGEPPSTATDVYQLGVLLHLLLVGVLPLVSEGKSRAERVRAALEDIPGKASDHLTGPARNSVRGDLDAIIGKTLQKKPEERYPTAAALAADLNRYLDHEPVRAREGALAYRAKKFVRRYRGAVIGTSAALTALLAATAFAFVQMRDAQVQRDQARFQERRGDAENQLLTQVMTTVGSDSKPVTSGQIMDASEAMLDKQYNSDPAFRVELLVRLATSFINLTDPERAVAQLQKAEALAEPLHSPLWTAQIQCAMVQFDISRDQMDKAAERLARGKAALATFKNPAAMDRVRCMDSEATLLDAKGDVRKALELEKTALKLLEDNSITRDPMYAEVLGSLQVYYSKLGDVKTTYEFANREVQVLESNGWGDSEVGVVGHHNLAVVLNDMGEHLAAAKEEGIAIERLRSNATDGLVPASASISYATMLLKLNRVPEAYQAADEAIRAAQRDADKVSEAYAHQSRAKVEVVMGQLEAAAADIAACKALMKGTEDVNSRVLAANSTAEAALLRARGKPHDAEQLAEAAIDRATKSSSGGESILAYLWLEASRAELAERRFPQAEAAANKAVVIFNKRARDPNLSADVGESLTLIAEAQRGEGQPQQAHESASRALPGLTAGLGPENPLTLEAMALR